MTKPELTALEALDRFAELAPGAVEACQWKSLHRMEQKEWADEVEQFMVAGLPSSKERPLHFTLAGIVAAIRATASAPTAAPAFEIVSEGPPKRSLAEILRHPPRLNLEPPPPVTSVERELLDEVRRLVTGKKRGGDGSLNDDEGAMCGKCGGLVTVDTSCEEWEPGDFCGDCSMQAVYDIRRLVAALPAARTKEKP